MSKLRYKEGGVWKSIAPSQKEFDDNKAEVTAQLAETATKKSLAEFKNRKIVNISLDDFELALKDITTNSATYTSIFNNSIFNNLKIFHDKYGVKFSLFCFGDGVHDITTTTTKFKAEFEENSDWLQFGFHGKNSSTFYNSATLAGFKTDYDKVINAIINFAGATTLCKVIRLHGFTGNSIVMNELANVYGINGVFVADDTRVSYDLTVAENNQLNIDYIFKKNNMTYYKSDIRYESETSVSTMLSKLETNKRNGLVLFTHDYEILGKLAIMEESFKWLVANGFTFSFYEDAPKVAYLIGQKQAVDLPYTLGSGWSVRVGHLLKIKIEGKKVHIQGQLEKSTSITSGETCLTLGTNIRPPSSLVIPSYCFDSAGSTLSIVAVLVQTNNIVTVGWRDSTAPVGFRCLVLDVIYYID